MGARKTACAGWPPRSARAASALWVGSSRGRCPTSATKPTSSSTRPWWTISRCPCWKRSRRDSQWCRREPETSRRWFATAKPGCSFRPTTRPRWPRPWPAFWRLRIARCEWRGARGGRPRSTPGRKCARRGRRCTREDRGAERADDRRRRLLPGVGIRVLRPLRGLAHPRKPRREEYQPPFGHPRRVRRERDVLRVGLGGGTKTLDDRGDRRTRSRDRLTRVSASARLFD